MYQLMSLWMFALWLFVLLLICNKDVVHAATPTVSIAGGGTVLMGSSATFSVTMGNSDAVGDPGYYPFVDVVFRGVRAVDVSTFTVPYLEWSYTSGVDTLSSDPLTVNYGVLPFTANHVGNLSCVDHPFIINQTGQVPLLCGEPGEVYLSAAFHVSPLTSVAPASVVTLDFPCTLELDSISELPLENIIIKARSGFRYGTDVNADNYAVDPPIMTDDDQDSSRWATQATVTPSFFIISSSLTNSLLIGDRYSGTGTVTVTYADDPNNLFQFNDIELSVDINPALVFTGITGTTPSAPDAYTALPATDQPYNPPLNNLTAVWAKATGTSNSISFSFYGNQFDADGNELIDPFVGTSAVFTTDMHASINFTVPSINSSTLYSQSTARSTTLTALTSTFTTTALTTYSPYQIVQSTMTMTIAQFFKLSNLTVTFTLTDGQRFHSEAVNYKPRLTVDGTHFFYFTNGTDWVEDNSLIDSANVGLLDVDAATTGVQSAVLTFTNQTDFFILNGTVTATDTLTIVYYSIIQDTYTDRYNPLEATSVMALDPMTQTFALTGYLRNKTLYGASTIAANGNAGYSIIGGSAATTSVEFYAIAGTICSPSCGTQPLVQSDSDLVMRIVYNVPLRDVFDLNYEIFLGSIVADVPVNITNLTVAHTNFPQDPYQVWNGPTDTLGVLPNLTADDVGNVVYLRYDTLESTANVAGIADLLIKFTTSDTPWEDMTSFVLLLYISEGRTQTTNVLSYSLVIAQPALTMRMRVTSITRSGSGQVVEFPDLSRATVDSGDRFTVEVFVNNTGHGPAYDVHFYVPFPEFCRIPGVGKGGLALQHPQDTTWESVTPNRPVNGVVDMFNQSRGLALSLPNPLVGFDNAKLNFTLQVKNDVPSTATILLDSELLRYASVEGGTNFVNYPFGVFPAVESPTVRLNISASNVLLLNLNKTLTKGLEDQYITIGEVVKARLSINAAQGLNNLTFRLSGNNAFHFYSASVVGIPEGANCTAAPSLLGFLPQFLGGNRSDPVWGNNHTVVFDFGEVNIPSSAHPNDTIDIDFEMYLTDRGYLKDDQGFLYNITLKGKLESNRDSVFNNTQIAKQKLTVVLPHLSLAASVRKVTGTDANDTNVLTVVASHDTPDLGGLSRSDAFDVWVNVSLKHVYPHLKLLTDKVNTTKGVINADLLKVRNGVVSVYVERLQLSDKNVTLHIPFEMRSSVQPEEVFTLHANATWKSSNLTQQRFSGRSFETSTSTSFTMRSTKLFVGNTTESLQVLASKFNNITIGEAATFQVTVRVPEATSNTSVEFVFDEGLTTKMDVLDARVAQVGTSVGSTITWGKPQERGNYTIKDLNSDGLNDTVRFHFGPLLVEGARPQSSKSVTIVVMEITAVAVDDAVNFAGQITGCTIRMSSGFTTATGTRRWTIVEPALQFRLHANVSTESAGEIVRYISRIRHDPTAISRSAVFQATASYQIPSAQFMTLQNVRMRNVERLNVTVDASDPTEINFTWPNMKYKGQDDYVEFIHVFRMTDKVRPLQTLQTNATLVWYSTPSGPRLDARRRRYRLANSTFVRTADRPVIRPGTPYVLDTLAKETKGLRDVAIGENFTVVHAVRLAEGVNLPGTMTIDVPASLIGLTDSVKLTVGHALNVTSSDISLTRQDVVTSPRAGFAQLIVGFPAILNVGDRIKDKFDDVNVTVSYLVERERVNAWNNSINTTISFAGRNGKTITEQSSVVLHNTVVPRLEISEFSINATNAYVGDAVHFKINISHLSNASSTATAFDIVIDFFHEENILIDKISAKGQGGAVILSKQRIDRKHAQVEFERLSQRDGVVTLRIDAHVANTTLPLERLSAWVNATYDTSPNSVRKQTGKVYRRGVDTPKVTVTSFDFPVFSGSSAILPGGLKNTSIVETLGSEVQVGEVFFLLQNVTFAEGLNPAVHLHTIVPNNLVLLNVSFPWKGANLNITRADVYVNMSNLDTTSTHGHRRADIWFGGQGKQGFGHARYPVFNTPSALGTKQKDRDDVVVVMYKYLVTGDSIQAHRVDDTINNTLRFKSGVQGEQIFRQSVSVHCVRTRQVRGRVHIEGNRNITSGLLLNYTVTLNNSQAFGSRGPIFDLTLNASLNRPLDVTRVFVIDSASTSIIDKNSLRPLKFSTTENNDYRFLNVTLPRNFSIGIDEILVLKLEVNVTKLLRPNKRVNVTIGLSGDSSPDHVGKESGQRFYHERTLPLIHTTAPVFSQLPSVFLTSLGGTPANNVTVGEEVVFSTTLRLPEGKVDFVEATFDLPLHLSGVSMVVASVGANLNITTTDPVVSSSGTGTRGVGFSSVTVSTGPVRNHRRDAVKTTGDDVQLLLTAVVEHVGDVLQAPQTPDGYDVNTTLEYQRAGGSRVTDPTDSTTVLNLVRPVITLSPVQCNSSRVYASDRLLCNMTMHSASNVPAYDVWAVVNATDSALRFVRLKDVVGSVSSHQYAPLNTTVSKDHLLVRFERIAPGEVVVISWVFRVSDTLAPSPRDLNISNSVRYDTSPENNLFNKGHVYVTSAFHSIARNKDAPLLRALEVLGTSTFFTVGSTLLKGENITLDIPIRLAEGKSKCLNLSIALGDNLAGLSTRIISVGANLNVTATDVKTVTLSRDVSPHNANGFTNRVLLFPDGIVSTPDGIKNTADDVHVRLVAVTANPTQLSAQSTVTASIDYCQRDLSVSVNTNDTISLPNTTSDPNFSLRLWAVPDAPLSRGDEIEAGSNVTFYGTLTHTELSAVAAFDIRIIFNVTDAFWTLWHVYPNVNSTDRTAMTKDSSVSNQVTLFLDEWNVTKPEFNFSVRCTAKQAVVATQSLGANAYVQYDTSPHDNFNNEGERFRISSGLAADVVVASPVLNVTRQSRKTYYSLGPAWRSANLIPNDVVSIGEIFALKTTVKLVEATYPNLTIIARWPSQTLNKLHIHSAKIVSVGSSITLGNAVTFATLTDTVGSDGRNDVATWNLGDSVNAIDNVANTNDEIELLLKVSVDDRSATAGVDVANFSVAVIHQPRWRSTQDTLDFANITFGIIEPVLNATLTDATPAPKKLYQAGDIVNYTMIIHNRQHVNQAAFGFPAFLVNVSITTDARFLEFQDSVRVSDKMSVANVTKVGVNHIVVTLDVFDVNDGPLEIRFAARATEHVQPRQTLQVNGEVSYSSSANITSKRRTTRAIGTSSRVGGPALSVQSFREHNYSVSTPSVVGSSLSETHQNNVSVGERFTVSFNATLPFGTTRDLSFWLTAGAAGTSPFEFLTGYVTGMDASVNASVMSIGLGDGVANASNERVVKLVLNTLVVPPTASSVLMFNVTYRVKDLLSRTTDRHPITVNGSFIDSAGTARTIAESDALAVFVKHPHLDFSFTTDSPTGADAGDSVSFLLRLFHVSDSHPAYDITILDPLHPNVFAVATGVVVTTSDDYDGFSTISFPSVTNNRSLRVSVPVLNETISLWEVNYTVELRQSVTAREMMAFEPSVRWRSSPSSFGYQAAGVNQSVTVTSANHSLPVPVFIESTSINSSVWNNVSVGEVLFVEFAVDVLESTSDSLTVNLTLPDGLSLASAVTADWFGYGSQVGTAGTAQPNAVVTGRENIFSFGGPFVNVFDNVLNGRDRFNGSIPVVVDDSTALSLGDTKTIRLSVDFVANSARAKAGTTSDVSLVSTVDISIAEPVLQATLAVNSTQGDAGDRATFRVNLTHVAQVSSAGAYDIECTAALPTEMQLTGSKATHGTTASSTAQLFNWRVARFARYEHAAALEGMVATFSVQLQNELRPHDFLDIKALCRYDTSPNDVGGNQGRVLWANSSYANVSAAMNTWDIRQFHNTSGSSTVGNLVTVGETITVVTTVRFPEGTTHGAFDTRVEQDFDSSALLVTSSLLEYGGNVVSNVLGDNSQANVSRAAGLVLYNLSRVINSFDNVESSDDKFTLTTTFRVLRSAGRYGEFVRGVNSTLYVNKWVNTTTTDAFTITEPVLLTNWSFLTECIAGNTESAVGTVNFTLLLQHDDAITGSDAFNLTIDPTFSSFYNVKFVRVYFGETSAAGHSYTIKPETNGTVYLPVLRRDANVTVVWGAQAKNRTLTDGASEQLVNVNFSTSVRATEGRDLNITDSLLQAVLTNTTLTMDSFNVSASSIAATVSPIVAIGEYVTWTARLLFPEGVTKNTTLLVEMSHARSAGEGLMHIVSAKVDISSSNVVGPSGSGVVMDKYRGDGYKDVAFFDMPLVVNCPDLTSDAADIVTVTVIAVVVDDPLNAEGVTLTTNVTLTNSTRGSSNVAFHGLDTLTIVEPAAVNPLLTSYPAAFLTGDDMDVSFAWNVSRGFVAPVFNFSWDWHHDGFIVPTSKLSEYATLDCGSVANHCVLNVEQLRFNESLNENFTAIFQALPVNATTFQFNHTIQQTWFSSPDQEHARKYACNYTLLLSERTSSGLDFSVNASSDAETTSKVSVSNGELVELLFTFRVPEGLGDEAIVRDANLTLDVKGNNEHTLVISLESAEIVFNGSQVYSVPRPVQFQYFNNVFHSLPDVGVVQDQLVLALHDVLQRRDFLESVQDTMTVRVVVRVNSTDTSSVSSADRNLAGSVVGAFAFETMNWGREEYVQTYNVSLQRPLLEVDKREIVEVDEFVLADGGFDVEFTVQHANNSEGVSAYGLEMQVLVPAGVTVTGGTGFPFSLSLGPVRGDGSQFANFTIANVYLPTNVTVERLRFDLDGSTYSAGAIVEIQSFVTYFAGNVADVSYVRSHVLEIFVSPTPQATISFPGARAGMFIQPGQSQEVRLTLHDRFWTNNTVFNVSQSANANSTWQFVDGNAVSSYFWHEDVTVLTSTTFSQSLQGAWFAMQYAPFAYHASAPVFNTSALIEVVDNRATTPNGTQLDFHVDLTGFHGLAPFKRLAATAFQNAHDSLVVLEANVNVSARVGHKRINTPGQVSDTYVLMIDVNNPTVMDAAGVNVTYELPSWLQVMGQPVSEPLVFTFGDIHAGVTKSREVTLTGSSEAASEGQTFAASDVAATTIWYAGSRLMQTTEIRQGADVEVNIPPKLKRDDVVVEFESVAYKIDVLDNDVDPDGRLDPDSLAIRLLDSDNTVEVKNGKLEFTAAKKFSGVDRFTYRVCDNRRACATATVQVVVRPRPPNLDDGDNAVYVPANVNETQNVTVTVLTPPPGGKITVRNKTINYDGPCGGPWPVSYRVCDEDNNCGVVNVNLTQPCYATNVVAGSHVMTITVPLTFHGLFMPLPAFSLLSYTQSIASASFIDMPWPQSYLDTHKGFQWTSFVFPFPWADGASDSEAAHGRAADQSGWSQTSRRLMSVGVDDLSASLDDDRFLYMQVFFITLMLVFVPLMVFGCALICKVSRPFASTLAVSAFLRVLLMAYFPLALIAGHTLGVGNFEDGSAVIALMVILVQFAVIAYALHSKFWTLMNRPVKGSPPNKQVIHYQNATMDALLDVYHKKQGDAEEPNSHDSEDGTQFFSQEFKKFVGLTERLDGGMHGITPGGSKQYGSLYEGKERNMDAAATKAQFSMLKSSAEYRHLRNDGTWTDGKQSAARFVMNPTVVEEELDPVAVRVESMVYNGEPRKRLMQLSGVLLLFRPGAAWWYIVVLEVQLLRGLIVGLGALISVWLQLTMVLWLMVAYTLVVLKVRPYATLTYMLVDLLFAGSAVLEYILYLSYLQDVENGVVDDDSFFAAEVLVYVTMFLFVLLCIPTLIRFLWRLRFAIQNPLDNIPYHKLNMRHMVCARGILYWDTHPRFPWLPYFPVYHTFFIDLFPDNKEHFWDESWARNLLFTGYAIFSGGDVKQIHHDLHEDDAEPMPLSLDEFVPEQVEYAPVQHGVIRDVTLGAEEDLEHLVEGGWHRVSETPVNAVQLMHAKEDGVEAKAVFLFVKSDDDDGDDAEEGEMEHKHSSGNAQLVTDVQFIDAANGAPEGYKRCSGPSIKENRDKFVLIVRKTPERHANVVMTSMHVSPDDEEADMRREMADGNDAEKCEVFVTKREPRGLFQGVDRISMTFARRGVQEETNEQKTAKELCAANREILTHGIVDVKILSQLSEHDERLGYAPLETVLQSGKRMFVRRSPVEDINRLVLHSLAIREQGTGFPEGFEPVSGSESVTCNGVAYVLCVKRGLGSVEMLTSVELRVGGLDATKSLVSQGHSASLAGGVKLMDDHKHPVHVAFTFSKTKRRDYVNRIGVNLTRPIYGARLVRGVTGDLHKGYQRVWPPLQGDAKSRGHGNALFLAISRSEGASHENNSADEDDVLHDVKLVRNDVGVPHGWFAADDSEVLVDADGDKWVLMCRADQADVGVVPQIVVVEDGGATLRTRKQAGGSDGSFCHRGTWGNKTLMLQWYGHNETTAPPAPRESEACAKLPVTDVKLAVFEEGETKHEYVQLLPMLAFSNKQAALRKTNQGIADEGDDEEDQNADKLYAFATRRPRADGKVVQSVLLLLDGEAVVPPGYEVNQESAVAYDRFGAKRWRLCLKMGHRDGGSVTNLSVLSADVKSALDLRAFTLTGHMMGSKRIPKVLAFNASKTNPREWRAPLDAVHDGVAEPITQLRLIKGKLEVGVNDDMASDMMLLTGDAKRNAAVYLRESRGRSSDGKTVLDVKLFRSSEKPPVGYTRVSMDTQLTNEQGEDCILYELRGKATEHAARVMRVVVVPDDEEGAAATSCEQEGLTLLGNARFYTGSGWSRLAYKRRKLVPIAAHDGENKRAEDWPVVSVRFVDQGSKTTSDGFVPLSRSLVDRESSMACWLAVKRDANAVRGVQRLEWIAEDDNLPQGYSEIKDSRVVSDRFGLTWRLVMQTGEVAERYVTSVEFVDERTAVEHGVGAWHTSSCLFGSDNRLSLFRYRCHDRALVVMEEDGLTAHPLLRHVSLVHGDDENDGWTRAYPQLNSTLNEEKVVFLAWKTGKEGEDAVLDLCLVRDGDNAPVGFELVADASSVMDRNRDTWRLCVRRGQVKNSRIADVTLMERAVLAKLNSGDLTVLEQEFGNAQDHEHVHYIVFRRVAPPNTVEEEEAVAATKTGASVLVLSDSDDSDEEDAPDGKWEPTLEQDYRETPSSVETVPDTLLSAARYIRRSKGTKHLFVQTRVLDVDENFRNDVDSVNTVAVFYERTVGSEEDWRYVAQTELVIDTSNPRFEELIKIENNARNELRVCLFQQDDITTSEQINEMPEEEQKKYYERLGKVGSTPEECFNDDTLMALTIVNVADLQPDGDSDLVEPEAEPEDEDDDPAEVRRVELKLSAGPKNNNKLKTRCKLKAYTKRPALSQHKKSKVVRNNRKKTQRQMQDTAALVAMATDPHAELTPEKQLELDIFKQLLVSAAAKTLSQFNMHLGMAYKDRRRGGITVDIVRKGKSGARAGLRPNDNLTAIDGVFIQNREWFTTFVTENRKAGDTIILTKQSNLTGQTQIKLVIGAKGVSMALFLKIVRMANGDVPAEYMVDIRLLQEIGVCDENGNIAVKGDLDSSRVMAKAEREKKKQQKQAAMRKLRMSQGLLSLRSMKSSRKGA